jgi:exodeoxyribonuclease VII small subunit
MTKDTQKNIQEMDFETAFAALQDAVTALETQELPLEDALERFEQGQRLAKHCATLLEDAELKVQKLSAETGHLTTMDG